MALHIRRLRTDELPLVRHLRIPPEKAAYFPLNWTEEEVTQSDHWGLWLDEQLIGWCRLFGQPPLLWVGRILIDAPYTGLGYGKAFLKQVLNEFRRHRRWREVRTAVHPDNQAAQRLFRALGFEPLPYEEQVGEVILRQIWA